MRFSFKKTYKKIKIEKKRKVTEINEKNEENEERSNATLIKKKLTYSFLIFPFFFRIIFRKCISLLKR